MISHLLEVKLGELTISEMADIIDHVAPMLPVADPENTTVAEALMLAHQEQQQDAAAA